MPDQPTLLDVSKHAGVSVATVSRVLSGSASVNAAKSAQVRRAVAKLNYQPLRKTVRAGSRGGTAARAQRASSSTAARTRTVAVVLLNRDLLATYSHDFAATLKAVARGLTERGMSLITCDLTGPAPDGVADWDRLPAPVRDGQIDGLLIAGDVPDDSPLRSLRKIPTVWLTSQRGARRDTVALAGNEHVGELAADYLIDRGCRRLACMDIATAGSANEVRRRYFAFAAQQAGFDTRLITGLDDLPRDDDPDGWDTLRRTAADMADQLLDAPHPPDGLFILNGLTTGMIYAALRQRGVEPGRDLQVVVAGHHQPVLAALHPTPASIDLHGEIIGRSPSPTCCTASTTTTTNCPWTSWSARTHRPLIFYGPAAADVCPAARTAS